MLKKLGLPALVMGVALSILSPTAALARDHDRDWRHERHEYREHERHVWREHFRPGFGVYVGPQVNGYYDRWGNWHPYVNGFYDQWGNWHPYGY